VVTVQKPVIEAHRGNSAYAPENTLTAFRQAVALGAPWIELDIHAAADGELIVMHDATVDRTTNGTGAIAAMTSAEIKRLDASYTFKAQCAGEPVPFLGEAIQLVGSGPVSLNVEIKGVELGGTTAQRIVRLLRDAPNGQRHLISSFDLDSLLAIRAACPDMVLAMLGNGQPALEQALANGCGWVHSQHEGVTAELVDRAHDAGVKVMAWTMDDPARFGHFVRLGIDKLCTNRPGDLLTASRAISACASGA
jgi:glycerophosphoryl diester phosphodiesterase